MAAINMKNNIIKVTFLGTGANGGIPQVDCRCQNCLSFNGSKKLRSSILVETNNHKIIIDCGPDFRQQLLKNRLRLNQISGIILTHLHWDHSIGLVELSGGKSFNMPIMAHQNILKTLKKSEFFGFLFKFGFAKSKKDLTGIKIAFIEVTHDLNFITFAIKLSVNGKSILFCSDILKFNEKLKNAMKKCKLVIFDGTFLNTSKHFHICIRESAPILKRLNNNVMFTHINHSENTETINRFLKKFNFQIAKDNLSVII